MSLSELTHGDNEVRVAAASAGRDAGSNVDRNAARNTGRIRPPAVAGAFYPADRTALKQLINQQLDYGRALVKQLAPRLPQGTPKAVIVPHAGYGYSGTTAALAYALLERGCSTVKRAVIVGPTHRVAVRGVACSTADVWSTPLGVIPVDVESERKAMGLSGRDISGAARMRGGDQCGGDHDGMSAGVDGAGQHDNPHAEPLRSGMRARSGAPAPAMIVNDSTHAQEHAVEVQIPFLQTVFGPDLNIVPLNAGDARPEEVGDVLRALWGGPETVIIISSDLSHYHPEAYARQLDDETIVDIAHLKLPIHPRRACGAYPINGLLDVLARGLTPAQHETVRETSRETLKANQASGTRPAVETGLESEHQENQAGLHAAERHFDLRLLGRSTSGDDGVVALAGEPRPAMGDPDEPVVGYASFAVWQEDNDQEDSDDAENAHGDNAGGIRQTESSAESSPESSAERRNAGDAAGQSDGSCTSDRSNGTDRGATLLKLARISIREHLGIDGDSDESSESIIARSPWLEESGASFVTLTENGRLRGCIGTLEAYRSLGRDVAGHAVDAASRDPRFNPLTAAEYPLIDVEVSVLGKPEPIIGPDGIPVRSRDELESALRPGEDGLILTDRRGRRATFLPQVWEQLPDPHDFVSHLLAKAGIRPSYDWDNGDIECERYEVTAYAER
ncbi:dioxygenase [Bifidobacterium sp. UTBIF-68]|uniref:AmmeMemoRadiSam system protein B n=1 Tax=Bifidobacterium sp. UTBIF-68 TaxID=1465262 RepID=UPI0021594029|nr:AmmeMemoRadiSam system protein B [Bifidobacterium sp. UTBIF-68]TPF94770.1 dioxygenase [Bifidobacterium sp. UTBIF-68]